MLNDFFTVSIRSRVESGNIMECASMNGLSGGGDGSQEQCGWADTWELPSTVAGIVGRCVWMVFQTILYRRACSDTG